MPKRPTKKGFHTALPKAAAKVEDRSDIPAVHSSRNRMPAHSVRTKTVAALVRFLEGRG